MHGSFDKPGENDRRIYQRWGIGFFSLPVFLVIALIVLMIIQPAGSNWIAEAVQAEFSGTNVLPEITPTQLARPTMRFRTVRAN
jgi:hypothetical protein